MNGASVANRPCKYLGPEDYADACSDVSLPAGENTLTLSVASGGETKIDVVAVEALKTP